MKTLHSERLYSERGFTLVEVVMASLILVLGITIISSIISEITTRNFFSHRHTQAVLLAENKIEELLNEGYESDFLDEGSYENPLNPIGVESDSIGVFYQFWTVLDVTPINRSKQITSTIRWEGMDGETKEVILMSVCIDQSN